jgi:hypothetical protein
MYYRLLYVFGGALPLFSQKQGVLPLKTLVLYIYQSRGTIQYNQPLYATQSILPTNPQSVVNQ